MSLFFAHESYKYAKSCAKMIIKTERAIRNAFDWSDVAPAQLYKTKSV